MKRSVRATLLILLFGSALFAGCRSLALAARGAVSERDRIPLSQSSQGVWEGRDLSVNYSFTKTGDMLEISGVAPFADSITMNYTSLNYFRLSLVFADSQGQVLGTQQLATSYGDFDTVRFSRRVRLPGNAAYLSFSYDGQAIDATEPGGNQTNFWYPSS